ncbi:MULTISPECIES: ThiF family adenylyltransferase [unclassified Thioalkalivibrio]|uniref:tRNA threonylcarbamoyladenosine dehydratase n=1 Tax=unclassified Thioalkalivibrio TaxID=2621013 RepID=UPI00037C56AA|nr:MULTISPECIES: tRNA threonylcarbamoyladenosine dehydratase [unclassified Thioalkalivibrio]
MSTSNNPYSERTDLLLGPDVTAGLRDRHVFIAGLGGVGSYAAEAIARAGVGRMTLVDHDVVAASNLNRQLVALRSTLDQPKTAVMEARIRDIDPEIELTIQREFLRPDSIVDLVPEDADFVLDAIDSIACKAALVAGAQRRGQAVISSMGAGGRIDPTAVRVGPLESTRVCPLARQMRKNLRRMDARLDYPVVFSIEQPRKGTEHRPVEGGRPRSVNGTISYLPAIFGLTAAGHVIQTLIARA